MTTIYGLLDPRTLELRYIGKTRKSAQARLTRHMCEARLRRSHRERWIQSIADAGMRPIIEAFDSVPGDGSAEEIAAIGIARSLGCRLVNGTAGGEGALGTVPSAETRAKISAANKGRKRAPFSAQVLLNMSLAQKGRKLTEEHKAKIALGNKGKTKGRKRSEEYRAKLSIAHKASWARRKANERENAFADEGG